MTIARLVRTVDWRFKSILVIETGLLMIILDLIDAVRKLTTSYGILPKYRHTGVGRRPGVTAAAIRTRLTT